MYKKTLFFLFILIALTSCSKDKNNNIDQPSVPEVQSESPVYIQESEISIIEMQMIKPMDALIFSDRVNIRNAPNLDGEIVGQLNTWDEITVFACSGSNTFEDGIWDRWYKISDIDNQWVNGYYVACFPIHLVKYKENYNRDIPFTIDTYSDFDTDSEIWTFFIITAEDKKEVFKDNPEVRMSEFAKQLTNEMFLEEPMQNIEKKMFKYAVDWRPDIEPYQVYEITIDMEENTGLALLYDIHINDPLPALKEKIGIKSLPINFGFFLPKGGDYVRAQLDGTDKLESIIWEITVPYGQEVIEW